MWQAGWGDEEFSYKLERCIYTFFMNGLSVFDSFAYALYFLGHAIQPAAFPDVAKLRNITRKATGKAFGAAFPQEPITKLLADLSSDAKFGVIDVLPQHIRSPPERQAQCQVIWHDEEVASSQRISMRKHGIYPAPPLA